MKRESIEVRLFLTLSLRWSIKEMCNEISALSFMDEILKCTIQMKASKQYFPVVLFIMMYKVVLTFESVDEILWCDHSNDSY